MNKPHFLPSTSHTLHWKCASKIFKSSKHQLHDFFFSFFSFFHQPHHSLMSFWSWRCGASGVFPAQSPCKICISWLDCCTGPWLPARRTCSHHYFSSRRSRLRAHLMNFKRAAPLSRVRVFILSHLILSSAFLEGVRWRIWGLSVSRAHIEEESRGERCLSLLIIRIDASSSATSLFIWLVFGDVLAAVIYAFFLLSN